MTEWLPVTRGESGAGVFRNADGSSYAKVVDAAAVADLAAERDRVSWAHRHGVPGPAVIDWRVTEDGGACLITSTVRGVAADRLSESALRAAWPAIVEAVRTLHALPADGCPYRRDLDDMLARARAVGVRFVAGMVWSASLPLQVEVHGEDGARRFRPRRLVVATGAFERPLPVPGWTLPGVMTTGAAQTLLRSYAVLPGRRVLVAGNGPLNLQVAGELRRAGAEIVLVAEAAHRPGAWALGPLAAMAAAAPGLTARGAGYLARNAGRVRWGARLAAVHAEGDALGVTLDDGSRWQADAVAMGYGFLPANELLRLLGCRHRYDPGRGHLVTERDGQCRTSIPDVLAVGDCCGLGGAQAAEAEGAIAGAAAVGRPPDPQALRALARQRRFQAALWRMFAAPCNGRALADPVCRCEEVELAAIDAALAAGATSLAAIKRATRAGMGRCQGRYCGPLLAGLLHERTGRALDEFAFFAPRPPVRPVPIGAIATAEESP